MQKIYLPTGRLHLDGTGGSCLAGAGWTGVKEQCVCVWEEGGAALAPAEITQNNPVWLH